MLVQCDIWQMKTSSGVTKTPGTGPCTFDGPYINRLEEGPQRGLQLGKYTVGVLYMQKYKVLGVQQEHLGHHCIPYML